jgi:cytochrome c oxidase subunit I
MATVLRTSIGADAVSTRRSLGQRVVKVITPTDHKVIGKLYLLTSFAWLLVGGIMAL